MLEQSNDGLGMHDVPPFTTPEHQAAERMRQDALGPLSVNPESFFAKTQSPLSGWPVVELIDDQGGSEEYRLNGQVSREPMPGRDSDKLSSPYLKSLSEIKLPGVTKPQDWQKVAPEDSAGFSLWQNNEGQRLAMKPIERADGSLELLSSDGSSIRFSTAGAVNLKDKRVTVADIKVLFDKNLAALDSDHDGYVSLTELEKASQSGRFFGDDAKLLGFLRSKYNQLSSRPGDRLHLFSDGGISGKDIDEFDQLQKKYRNSVSRLDVVTFATGNFERIDANHDGRISAAEITKALSAGDLDEGYLRRLNDLFTDIAKPGSGLSAAAGISLDDLDSYLSKLQINPDAKEVITGQQALDGVENSESKNLRQAFATPENPLNSIQPQAIRQGALGDCYFLASVTSLAETPHGKQLIKDMIKDNQDGTYTVTFADDPGNPVRIAAPGEADMAIYQSPGQYGNWPAILERAYGAYRNQQSRHSDFKTTGEPSVVQENGRAKLDYATIGDTEGAGGGGNPAEVLELLTGDKHAGRSWLSSMTDDRLSTLLTEFTAAQKPVVASTSVSTEVSQNLPNIESYHAYSLVGYDRYTKTVTLRNPWGQEIPSNVFARDLRPINGILTLSLSDFKKHFDLMQFSYNNTYLD